MPASDFPKFVIPLLCLPRECGFAGLQQRIRDTAHCGYHNDRLGIAHRLNDACRLIDLWHRAYRRASKFDDDHDGSLTLKASLVPINTSRAHSASPARQKKLSIAAFALYLDSRLVR